MAVIGGTMYLNKTIPIVCAEVKVILNLTIYLQLYSFLDHPEQ